jgi:hypothetical protein
MKRIVPLAIAAIIITASLIMAGCGVALGAMLNLKGPVVTIKGPRTEEGSKTDPAVGTLFEFWGTATTDSTVAKMSVTLLYFNRASNRTVQMGREWKWENGVWQKRESSSGAWQRYDESVYHEDNDTVNPLEPGWERSGNTVIWKLPIWMERMEKGQFFVVAQAWDSTGNSDSNSTDRVKVEFSNNNPTLRIEEPVLLDGEGSLAFPEPPDFSGGGYLFDPFEFPLQTYQNRKNFTNKFSNVKWIAEQSAPLDKVTFEITNKHNLDTVDGDPGKLVYYHGEFTNVGFGDNLVPTRAYHSDDSVLIGNNNGQYKKIGPAIQIGTAEGAAGYDETELQNNVDALPPGEITPLQIVSTVVDNLIPARKEYKSKGWLLWLPDSDKPFADISFGYKVKADDTGKPLTPPPADACELKIVTRGTTRNKIYLYDDDGLTSFTWKINRLLEDSFEEDPAFEYGILHTETISNSLTQYAYDFAADYSFGIGRYKLEVVATDNHSKNGDRYIAYFTIASNNAPIIRDWPMGPDTPMGPESDGLAGPDSSRHESTRWGNNSGTVNFRGTAAIEGAADGTVKVNGVTVVLLNYEGTAEAGAENTIRFTEPSYEGWNKGTAAGFTDSYGNKIWEIPANQIQLDPATAGNAGVNHMEDWLFTRPLNWFTDLDGWTSTKDKNFIVRALSRGVLGTEYYGTRTFTLHGDDTPPTVDITHLQLQTRPNNTSNVWTNFTGMPTGGYPLATYGEIFPSLSQNSRIKLIGTWADDSGTKWTTLPSGKTQKDLFKSIKIRWEGNQNQYTLTIPTNGFTIAGAGNGTWETDWFNGFPESTGNVDPSIALSAEFIDLGENPGKKERFITVETDTPTLARVSSEEANGDYGQGKIVTMYLGFNKPVYLERKAPIPDTASLKLVLSNGARATYVSGLGTMNDGSPDLANPADDKIKFQYIVAGTDSDTNGGKLNVVSIEYGSCAKDRWKSHDKSEFFFPEQLYRPENMYSLAGQKNIVIDLKRPTIERVTTSAANNRIYGKAQELIFTVEFNEVIDTSALTASTYLVLGGGNMGTNNKFAVFNGKSGTKSALFRYVTSNGEEDNTGNNNLSISQIVGSDKITDKAGNKFSELSGAVQITAPSLVGKNVKINTMNPDAPSINIGGSSAGGTFYGDVTITVTSLKLGATCRWEYNTGYSTSNPQTTGWISTTTGTTAGNRTITLNTNGTYNVAVRQFDDASPENGSVVSNVIQNIVIDKGGVLTKITSANSSGTYGSPDTIAIVFEFRKAVTITGATGSNGSITLNTAGGANTVNFQNGSSTDNKLTVNYSIPDGAYTPTNAFLNVTGISTTGIEIRDAQGTLVNSFVTLAGVSEDNRLNKQKEITILSGRPAMTNNNFGTAANGNQATWFNGTELGVKFDRALYRGTTSQKLIIRQIAGATYRIPAVLTEQKFSDIFQGRSDMFAEQGKAGGILNSILGSGDDSAKAVIWQNLGKWLYEQGSNGATESGGRLTPDTTVKYVLRFTIDTATGNSTDAITVPATIGITGNSITKANLTDLFRAAEALTYTTTDPNVTISGNNLTVALPETGRGLPVRGASYEWFFPNGFVTDILGKTNGSSTDHINPTGNDANISNNGTSRQLLYINGATTGATGRNNIKVESPVIRIDKGDDLVYFNDARTDTTSSDMTRQARQKLTTQVKMDCRTPGTTIAQSNKSATDAVRPIIMRTAPTSATTTTNRQNFLPNLGSAVTREAWEAVRMRPQSGGGTWNNNNTPGLNVYTPVTTTWSDATNYTAALNIGSSNYSDGGQEFNYRASATANNLSPSDYAYETAYRSVLVYSRVALNENANVAAVELGGTANRVWIRGSNTPQGDPTIPDFPLARSGNLWRKIRPLTPIDSGTAWANNTNFTVANIPTNQDANGRYLWFWVTWRINVPAFIDIQYGALPTAAELSNEWPNGTGGIQAPYGTTLRKLFRSFITSVEHYAVHPGRTTVVEPRSQGQMWDGDHGGLSLTTAVAPLKYTDK